MISKYQMLHNQQCTLQTSHENYVAATEKYYKDRIHLPETGAGPSPLKHRSLVVDSELEHRIGMVLSEERKFVIANRGPSAFGYLINNN